MEILSSRVILRPSDYERTLAFYRDLLGLAVYREYPGGTVFFAGQALVEIAGHPGPEAASDAGTHTALWLQVRDAHRVQADLTAAGVEIVRPATQEPWGLIELWIHDPDGVPIVFVEVPAEHPIRRDLRPTDPVRPTGA